MRTVDITIASDFICPWCWIGHRNLRAALRQVRAAVAPLLRYWPLELNPEMPPGGMSRRQYRGAHYGGPGMAQAIDAGLTLAGLRAGARFAYDKVALTPNTRAAHRLMYFAQNLSAAGSPTMLFDAVFTAHFHQGRDIGDAGVLADLAGAAGLDRRGAADFLAGPDGHAQVATAQALARADHVRSLPTFFIGDIELAGVQPPSVFVAALREAAALATER